MAGSPKKRARREQPANDAIPDAINTGDLPPVRSVPNVSRETLPLRAGARAPAHTRASGADLGAGPQARAASDTLRGGALAGLGAVLRYGTTVRLERTRPLWAAGFIEDYTVDRDGVPQLLEYLRDEHGGQLYRAIALSPNGSPVADFTIPIAGPVRLRGRAVTREAFERDGEAAPTTPAPIHGAPSSDTQALVTALLTDAREARKEQNLMVRELMKVQRPPEPREPREPRRSLAAELGELAQTQEAIDKLARRRGGPAERAATAAPPTELRDKLKERFGTMIMGKMINEFSGGGGRPPGPPRRPMPPPAAQNGHAQPSPVRPPQQPIGDGIPDAL